MMQSFALIATVFVLHAWKANGGDIFDFGPALGDSTGAILSCIRSRVCDCGEENELRKCTDKVEDVTFRRLIDKTSQCSGLEKRMRKDTNWLCKGPNSCMRQCGEQLMNQILTPAIIPDLTKDALQELTVEERFREFRSLAFFPCILKLIAKCITVPEQC
ncbi:uncharacterized protein LOC129225582 [Uloborus diversus]|uniref:uncharacterized protein LOC129225582 n=1 Tax=Uloborus diversus TaxID=327109 RepID=UPI002409FDC8|nr:uncharacterized protein LOC129225582 [Uloborus diversus]